MVRNKEGEHLCLEETLTTVDTRRSAFQAGNEVFSENVTGLCTSSVWR